MSYSIIHRGLGTAFLVTAFLVAAAVPAVFAKGDMPLTGTKEAVALFIQAREKGENLEDTGALFDQVISKDPNFAYAYLFAGQNNLEFQKNIETAVRLADKASPGERELIFAARDQSNGNTAGQLSHLQQLLKLFPGDKRAHMQMSNYLRAVGDDVEALHHLQEAVKIDSKYAPAYNLIGYSNIALGKYADAEAAFQTYIKLIPNNPNPYDSYAELLMTTGKFDASIKQYEMALAKDPTFVNSYRGMGNDYEYKGDHTKAREMYYTMFTKSTNGGNRDQALSSTMNSWLFEGNFAKALEVNEKRIAVAEKEGDVQTAMALHNVSALISFEAGDLDAAAKCLDIAAKLSQDPSLRPELKDNRKFAAYQQQLRMMLARADFEGAKTQIEGMKMITATRPNLSRPYNTAAGNAELAQKNYAKANEFYAGGNPQDPYMWYNSALAYEGAGDSKKAAELYRKVADLNQLDTTGYALVRTKAIAKLNK